MTCVVPADAMEELTDVVFVVSLLAAEVFDVLVDCVSLETAVLEVVTETVVAASALFVVVVSETSVITEDSL